MDSKTETRLWEEIYRLRIKVEALEGVLLPNYRNKVAADMHALVLDRVVNLPGGPQREGGLRAYDEAAFKSDRGKEVRLTCT